MSNKIIYNSIQLDLLCVHKLCLPLDSIIYWYIRIATEGDVFWKIILGNWLPDPHQNPHECFTYSLVYPLLTIQCHQTSLQSFLLCSLALLVAQPSAFQSRECYASWQTCVLGLGFTDSEGGTHKETQHPQRSLKGEISKAKGQGHNG